MPSRPNGHFKTINHVLFEKQQVLPDTIIIGNLY